jgi:alpha-tubulin suppressor-like RCC1 family protein
MSRPNQFLSPEGDIEDYFVDEYWLIDQWVGDTLWTWGNNNIGQLGDNTLVRRSTPVTTFAGGANWKQVSGGDSNTAAIKIDGTLWTWGSGSTLQLGDNTLITKSIPVTTFAGGTNWKQVTCGSTNTAAIKTDGTLWIWGSGSTGRLGTNATTSSGTPVTTFAGGTNWKQVACGQDHTSAIKTDGTLWTWGSNNSGRLGDNTNINRATPVTTFAGGTNWKQVSCGLRHTSAIKTDGTLWTWGDNDIAQLGNNTITVRSTPVTTFAGGNNWKQVSCGYVYTAAIKTDGTLWTWGRNTNGQLGDNTLTTRSTPVTTFAGGTNWKQVDCGSIHTSAIKTDGTLWTWGNNAIAQLGNNTATLSLTPITTFAGGTNWKQISCGDNFIAAVTSGTDPTFFIS